MCIMILFLKSEIKSRGSKLVQQNNRESDPPDLFKSTMIITVESIVTLNSQLFLWDQQGIA